MQRNVLPSTGFFMKQGPVPCNNHSLTISDNKDSSSDNKDLGIGLTENRSIMREKKGNKTKPRDNEQSLLQGVLRSHLRVRHRRHH